MKIYTYVCANILFMETRTENLEKAAFILKTIAHPTRLAIIDLLNEHKQLPVNEVCKLLDAEQSIISHHLINMRTRGLLKATKSGNSVLYSLKEQNLTHIMTCVNNCNCNL
jgi:DNA-binding transcriptional ArsR family regulator